MKKMEQIDLKSYTYQQMEKLTAEMGLPRFRAGQIFGWLHEKRVSDFDEMTNLPAALRSQLAEKFYINAIRVKKRLVSSIDGTVKYLYELRGMGTTVVAAVMMDGMLCIAHVGDSRAYLCESGAAPRRLTRDHSVVQMLVESGEISEEEARQHPKRNYITRALGVEAAVELEYVECAYTSGRLLLCTDGLYNYAPPEEHVDLIMTCESEQDIFLLIDEANKVGGPDNITAVIAAM